MEKVDYRKTREYKAPSKKVLYIHIVVYIVTMAVLWYIYYVHNAKLEGAAYPWEGWLTGTWFLALTGHFCNTFFDNNRNNQDKFYMKYLYEKDH
jgi:2TM domain